MFIIILVEKQIYNGLPDLMTKLAVTELENLSEEVQECQVIYVPQVRWSYYNIITEVDSIKPRFIPQYCHYYYVSDSGN